MDKERGLIYAYLLDGKGGGSDLSWDEIERWSPSQGILWMHLDYQNEYACRWLQEKSGLGEVAREALLEEETRPRFFHSENGFLMLLRGVNFNPGSDPEDMVSLRVWTDGTRIISMRHRLVKAIEDVHKALTLGNGPSTPAEFIVMVTDRITDRMGDIITSIDDGADELEDLVLSMEGHELRARLADIRRTIISLRRYVVPQRDMLLRLYLERLSGWSEKDIIYMRESAERTARYVEDLDSARERAAITQEEMNSRHSEKMNKTMYILSLVAAIFLPLSLLTGLLGINVGGIPGADNRSAFLIVCALIVVIAIIEYWIFKWRKWL